MTFVRTIIVATFSFIPYLLVSWGYMVLVNGGSRQLWGALGVLIAIRLFFSLIETLGSILYWRLYGKTLTVNKFLELLQTNNYPKREYQQDDVLAYLHRIQEGPYADPIKRSAREMYFLLSTFESMGILLGMRTYDAAEVALGLYSSKAESAE